MKRYFTAIELLVVVAISMIVCGITIPVVYKVRYKNRFNKYKNEYNIPDVKAYIKMSKDGLVDKKTGEPTQMYDSSMKEKEEVVKTDVKIDLYSDWCDYTGNPEKLTRQQFKTLLDTDTIPELKYEKWTSITNSKLNREQFEALKKKGLIRFPKQEPEPKSHDPVDPKDNFNKGW